LPDDVEVWIKRDELTGLEVSGNKIRKLEFCLADAQEQGCDTIITCGGVQSNHCRATAVLGARLGFKVHLLLRGEPAEHAQGNLLLDQLAGAEITYVPASRWSEHQAMAKSLQDQYQQSGNSAYFIPVGASDAVGLWGYIAACQELQQDFEREGLQPDTIVCATGSGGTQGGLLVGARMMNLSARVLAFNVSDDAAYFEHKIREDVTLWKQRYKTEFDLADLDITTLEGYLGPGYGAAGPEVFATIRELARSDGIFLDPVYTGKAFHGMVTELNKGASGRLAGAAQIVFIHTGGLFGVFPQNQQFNF
jgi:D-cysteine desulfhydrase